MWSGSPGMAGLSPSNLIGCSALGTDSIRPIRFKRPTHREPRHPRRTLPTGALLPTDVVGRSRGNAVCWDVPAGTRSHLLLEPAAGYSRHEVQREGAVNLRSVR